MPFRSSRQRKFFFANLTAPSQQSVRTQLSKQGFSVVKIEPSGARDTKYRLREYYVTYTVKRKQ